MLSPYVRTGGRAGRGAEAQKEATGLLRSDDSRPDFLCLRARALAVQGNMDHAVTHLQQALRRDPDNSECKSQFKALRRLQRSKQEGNEHFKSQVCTVLCTQ